MGNPRSGTTWVMNLLASMPGYRSAFEPLAHRGGRLGRPRRLRPNPEELKAYLGRVLSEPYPADSPLYRLSAIQRPLASQTVVKLVDANDLLGWLAETFPARLVLLRRHPLDVLKSRLRLGWPLPAQLIDLPANQMRPFQPMLQSLQESGSEIERFYTRTWLENWLGTALAQHHKAVICDYEELVAAPLERATRLFLEIGFQPPPALPQMLQRRSDTSWSKARRAELTAEQERRLADLDLRLVGASQAQGR